MAFDLAYDKKISGSITHARYRQRGNNHRAQDRQDEIASAHYLHNAHKQPLS